MMPYNIRKTNAIALLYLIGAFSLLTLLLYITIRITVSINDLIGPDGTWGDKNLCNITNFIYKAFSGHDDASTIQWINKRLTSDAGWMRKNWCLIWLLYMAIIIMVLLLCHVSFLLFRANRFIKEKIGSNGCAK
jgi:hypothetical protein